MPDGKCYGEIKQVKGTGERRRCSFVWDDEDWLLWWDAICIETWMKRWVKPCECFWLSRSRKWQVHWPGVRESWFNTSLTQHKRYWKSLDNKILRFLCITSIFKYIIETVNIKNKFLSAKLKTHLRWLPQ